MISNVKIQWINCDVFPFKVKSLGTTKLPSAQDLRWGLKLLLHCTSPVLGVSRAIRPLDYIRAERGSYLYLALGVIMQLETGRAKGTLGTLHLARHTSLILMGSGGELHTPVLRHLHTNQGFPHTYKIPSCCVGPAFWFLCTIAVLRIWNRGQRSLAHGRLNIKLMGFIGDCWCGPK